METNSVSLQRGEIAASKREMRELELIDYKNSSSALESMFPDSVIQSTYKKLLLELKTNTDNLN
jgi:hypothetical protein